jgi:glucose/arabinose dehydrogenase
MSRRAKRILAIVATAVVLLAGAGVVAAWRFGLLFVNPSVQGVPVAVPDRAVQTLATDLEVPWAVAFLPDGDALVTERGTGRILRVTAPPVAPDSDATDLSGRTEVREVARITGLSPEGEGGLLGIAVSPTYATDGWIYVYYTATDDNRLVRLRLDGGTPEPLLTGVPKAKYHNAGRIAFGPDGLLYIGTGDATEGGASQSADSLAGKILRVTAEGKPAPGNPVAGSPVYSLGHRNVQGLAWDATGQLYAAEFGQNRYDELNRIVPGGNYGWPRVEGFGDDPSFVNPIATWSTGDASPSGLAIVDGRAYLACLRGTKLYRIGLDGSNPEQLLSGAYGRLRSVTVAPDGTLWVTTSNRDGRGNPVSVDDRLLRLIPDRMPA